MESYFTRAAGENTSPNHLACMRRTSKVRLKILATMLFLCLPSPGLANNITLIVNSEAAFERADGNLRLYVKIVNEGDEEAVDVGAEFPSLDQRYTLAPSLAPRQSVEKSLEIDLRKMRIDRPGTYIIFWRTTYRDPNYYPFSAANQLYIYIPPLPAPMVEVSLTDLLQKTRVRISGKLRLPGEVRNLGGDMITIQRIEPFSAAELSVRLEADSLPRELDPGQALPFLVEVLNDSALAGSVYSAKLAVSGLIDGKHFAESIDYAIEVDSSSSLTAPLLTGLLLIAGAVYLSLLVRARKRSCS